MGRMWNCSASPFAVRARRCFPSTRQRALGVTVASSSLATSWCSPLNTNWSQYKSPRGAFDRCLIFCHLGPRKRRPSHPN